MVGNLADDIKQMPIRVFHVAVNAYRNILETSPSQPVLLMSALC